MDPLHVVFLIVVFGLLFDYTNGFHDAANVVSTVIATKVLRPIPAVVLSGIFNALGALLITGVAKTIAAGIVSAKSVSELMVLSSVMGAIVWNLITWYFGIPSSSSYALIGGLLGSALMHGGGQIILWLGVTFKVLIPMILSPIVGFFVANAFMRIVDKIESDNTPKLFKILQLCSATLMALAHGINDAQKSMGLITLGLFSVGIISSIEVPLWVIVSCALVIGLGTATGGFRIIRTIGYKITSIRPSQGFAAEASSALIIIGASAFGMPLSSTQMVTGSVSGVGAAKGMRNVNWSLLRKIVWMWIITLPGAGLIAAGCYYIFITLTQGI